MSEFTGSAASQADFIWKNAEDLWGDFKHTDFGKIILPFTLLRRLECALEPTREAVREAHDAFKDADVELDTILRSTAEYLDDIDDYFAREVLPHVPDAWLDESFTDARDGQLGRVGYEINFNRFFYQYQPPRKLHDIDEDLKQVEAEIAALLAEVASE